MKDEYALADTWVSYEIHPETPPGGVPLEEYFRNADLAPMHEMLRARAAEFGLPFSAPRILSNSRAAILAVEHARGVGRQEALRRRIFAAYFAEGQDIGDIEVLGALAVEVGVEAEALRSSVTNGVNADRLAEAGRQARHLGITGVPTFLITRTDGGAPAENAPRRIVGAQPLDVFRAALARE